MNGDNPSVIDYAGNKTPRPKSQVVVQVSTLILLFLTFVAVTTCLRIEILNARLGYYLPRGEYNDTGELVQWHHSSITNESRWRHMMSYRDPTIETRPMTPSEILKLQHTIDDNRCWNALLDAVSSWGLLQYPLVFITLIGFPFAFLRNRQRLWKSLSAIGFTLSMLCGILMVYRGYFTSLGM